MNRNNFWRFAIVVVVVLWSVYEIIPPNDQDLIQKFRERTVRRDTNFNAIVDQALKLQKAMPEKTYEALQTAIGTNDINPYFPFYEAGSQSHPTTYILNRLQREAAGKIRRGMDLQGGTEFLLMMNTNQLKGETRLAMDQAVEVIRKRVDRFGVAEPLIQQEGENRIQVALPGLSAEAQSNAIVQLKRAAFLEFKLVHPQSDELIKEGVVEPGYEIMRPVERSREGGKASPNESRPLLVRKRAEMVGGIKSAQVVPGTTGPEIQFTLDSEGTAKFARITAENIHRQLAIILDGELYSAPVIQGEIPSGSGEITGNFDLAEAQRLADVLENPLRAPLELQESRSIDPTLGKDAISSGIKACIFGTVFVSLFMLVYYMIAGLVANIALIANIIILVGVMCAFGTTFTLPGLAGIVLTVGMAVDANVLIYERIREESAKGKSLRGAIAAGYSRAFTTIFDSHVTTLISSVILMWRGTGSIKGFGVALTIGVAASLFTALVVTRLIFDWLLDRGWLKSVPMLHIIRATKLDFMRLAKPAFAMSWILICIGIFWGGYRISSGRGLFGVDFRGGDTISFKFEQKGSEKPDVKLVRDAITGAGIKDPHILYEKDLSTGRETLRVDTLPGTADTVKTVMAGIPGAKFEPLKTDSVGPTVGQEIQRSAIIASLLSLFGILIYVAVRYEFSFAVGAVVAVIHDVLMTIGWYCLSGREFNATTVAAILTIIGFSTNDTIVIFDRIREDLRLGLRGTFKEVMNQALNQTLSRTIITSGTVFLATVSLYIFGGGAINDFAFTFLVGIITGTYSSIYIASALVLWWHKGQRPAIGGAPIAVQNVEAVARA